VTGKRSRKAVVALLAASLLAGCATEPGGLGPGATAAPGPTTPEQRRLGNYANSFAVQGGVLGGLVGAALGCAVGAAVKGKEGCAYGAVAGLGVGAVAGGVGGNVLKTRTNQAMSEEQRLRAQLTAADRELALARQTEADTRQVVAGHRRELAGLEQRVQQGQASTAQMQTALAAARRDAANIEKSAKGLDAQVTVLSQELNTRMQNGFGVPPELVRKRDALAAQRDALASQHRSIIAMINEAEKVA
jgi:hypothetical protein